MKKVFVALANKEYIPYSKSLFYNVKDKWDGDFVLIVPEEDRGTFDEKEFTDRGIEIFYGKTLFSVFEQFQVDVYVFLSFSLFVPFLYFFYHLLSVFLRFFPF